MLAGQAALLHLPRQRIVAGRGGALGSRAARGTDIYLGSLAGVSLVPLLVKMNSLARPERSVLLLPAHGPAALSGADPLCGSSCLRMQREDPQQRAWLFLIPAHTLMSKYSCSSSGAYVLPPAATKLGKREGIVQQHLGYTFLFLPWDS